MEELGVTLLTREAQLATVGGRFIFVGPMFSPSFPDLIRGFWNGFKDSW